MPITKDNICGIILAGGQSSRMRFENKALLKLGTKPLIAHVIDGAKPQVGQLVINANRDIERFNELAIPVLKDNFGPEAGPLAGIVTGMQYARLHLPNAQAIACFPADVPWFPNDTVARLATALCSDAAQVAWLCTNGQWQPLLSLWSLSLEDVLISALAEGLYSPMALIRALPNSLINIMDSAPGDFENLNTPADLARANAQMRALKERV